MDTNSNANNYIVRDFKESDAVALSQMIREDIKDVNIEDPDDERDYLYNFYTPENIIKNAKAGHHYTQHHFMKIEDINTHSVTGKEIKII